MKQKAVVMATAFTMLLAVGITGFGSEVLHQHPAYSGQNARIQIDQVPALTGTETLLLTAPTPQENE